MLKPSSIVTRLSNWGHLQFPFGERKLSDAGLRKLLSKPLRLDHPAVRLAIESVQDFMAYPLERLIAKHHPERRTAAVRVDGRWGPALDELARAPRCGYPDYQAATDELVGVGQWKRCHGIGEFHAASVNITNSPPSFLAPVFEEVLKRVVQSYDEVGLRFYFDGRSPRQIDFSFVGRSSGWIGLAILGSTNLTCTSSPIWCRYLSTYRGGSTIEAIIQQWVTLVKHELGHNCGLEHSRGGVMNPSIINGLPTSWQGDPSRPILARRFGGEPVPGSGPREPYDWIANWWTENLPT